MEQIRVNIRTAVNAKAIRREQYNGREHIVVPSFTLPDGVVMNGGMYPKEEIDASFAGLEGTLAPLGHPQVEGQYVSARAPEAINAYHVGAFNRNVKRDGHRVSIEKWLDVEYAKNSEGGRAVLEAIDKGDPIHTSTGIFLEREMTPNADGHEWVARKMVFDHDAILINQEGAATPAQGVGMLVNKQLVINSELPDEEAQLALVDEAVKKLCEDEAAHSEVKVNRLKGWLQSLIQWNSKQTEPVQAIKPEEQDMTPEEVQAIVDKAIGAVNQSLESVQAENAALKAQVVKAEAAIAANAESGLAAKRALVAEKLGEVIANSLSGDALDDAVARCSVAAPLVGGFQGNAVKDELAGYVPGSDK
jgi:hypothetical protein